MILLIRDCCKSVDEIPLVHWIASAIFRVSPALGALGFLHLSDPSVLTLGASALGSSAEMSASCSSLYSGPSSSSSMLRREAM
jgi:hypothetical protein